MCIAILNTKGITLKKKLLGNCWDNNYDGAGFMYTDGEKIVVHKELNNFNAYYDAYVKARRDFPKSNMVLHFRISTHGGVTKANAHPFLVNKQLGFVHNGIISGMENSTKYSDTYMFNKNILKPLPSDFIKYDDIVDVIEDAIGSYNKLIFLGHDNEYVIVNEAAGYWDNGCWFSNKSYTYSSGYVDRGGVKTYVGKPTAKHVSNRFNNWDDMEEYYPKKTTKWEISDEEMEDGCLYKASELPKTFYNEMYEKTDKNGTIFFTRRYEFMGYHKSGVIAIYRDNKQYGEKKKDFAPLVKLLN